MTQHQEDEQPHRVDIHDLVAELCERLGLKSDFVERLEIDIDTLTAHVFRGTEGICKGSKYVNRGLPGMVSSAATDELRFRVKT